MIAMCSHCHICGTRLKSAQTRFEDWCPHCKCHRRYRSHGWIHAYADKTPCPTEAERLMLQKEILKD